MAIIRQVFVAITQGDKRRFETFMARMPADTMNESMSLLHCAVEHGHLEIVNMLLQKNATVDILDLQGSTPLHYCAKFNRAAIARLLLDKSAIMEAKDPNGATPLHWACQAGSLDTFKVLCERGADIESKAKFDTTPLHISARSGNPQLVQMLLQLRANIETKTNKGYTALHIAAMKGSAEVVNILLQFRAQVDALSLRKSTPLHFASIAGDVQTVQLLIHFGADINAVDMDRNTPLSNAVKNNHQYLVAILDRSPLSLINYLDDNTLFRIFSYLDKENDLKNASLTCKRFQAVSEGCWASFCKRIGCKANPQLMRVRWSAHYSIVRQIRSCYQQQTREQLESALLLEIQRIGIKASQPSHINPEVSAMVLIDHGVSPNAIHPKTRAAAVHMALQKKAFELAHMLVERGADINAQKTTGNSPLHEAAAQGEERVAVWLVDIGADPNLPNQSGDSPSLHAARVGQWKLTFALLKKGANINIRNHHEEGLIHHAAATSSGIQNIHKLLDLGADINLPGFAGNTALHNSALEGNADVMKVLLERGADVNAVNNGNASALHLACFYDNANCVQLLMQYGANLNIKNSSGHTPYYFARLLKKTRISELFESVCTVNVSRDREFYLLPKNAKQ